MSEEKKEYIVTLRKHDDLNDIFGSIKDNALLSKFAGGIGNDWSNVRAARSKIKSTNDFSYKII